MSWLARSLADSLRIDGGGEEAEQHHNEPNIPNNSPIPPHSPSEQSGDEDDEDDRAGRGVREDISELTETLSRQFWGVASFLAPPPPPPPPPRYSPLRIDRFHSDRLDSDRQAGVSGAHDEVVGGFRDSSYGRSSNHKVESEIWNMGSSFVPYRQEDPVVDAVGITEEVLAFARNIAHHPETWLDFPIEEEDDTDELEMTDALYSHALAIQQLAPRLAALRIELSPAHMSDAYFWKVYFVLLHSRLNKHDAELLSTPQIVAARALWIRELQKKTKAETTWPGRGTPHMKENPNTWQVSYDETQYDDSPRSMPPHSIASESPTYTINSEFVSEKHLVVSTDMQIVDKSVIEEEPVKQNPPETFVPRPSFKVPIQCYDNDDDDDDWLKDDSELEGYNSTAIHIGDEEDVSFSDLEDDDDCTMPLKQSCDSLKPRSDLASKPS